jgi:Uma2 family endonuclease
MSVTFAGESVRPVTVPARATSSLDSFREWIGDHDLPEKTRTDYYRGEVWIDMSQEQLFTHGAVKTEIARVLSDIAKREKLGRYWCNGILVTIPEAELSGNPDGTFVSHHAVASGNVTFTPGAEGGYVEVVGVVDMVLEVVSDSSEKKDNQTLFEAYFEAGIPEYWLVDARGSVVEFTIYKHSGKKYAVTRAQAGGWQKSGVFDKAFRIARGSDASGNPEFTLEVR